MQIRLCSCNIIQSQYKGAMQQKKQSRLAENVRYSQQVKDFLSKYKVTACTMEQAHLPQQCENNHSGQDRRRNPYKGHNLAYYPANSLCDCKNQNCRGVHNQYEYYFHPFIYKTTQCGNIYCNLRLFCYMAHQYEIPYLQKNYFFRFDLQTFKTSQCQINHTNNSEYASCRFYHADGDRRRDHSQVNYSHLECGNKTNCTNIHCQFSHNKIEQLYHPHRYKSKYCSKTLKGQPCQYLQFCSFAHVDQELTIELLHKIYPQDQHFHFYKFKTVWCPFTENHDRSNCNYAHNFNDYRRDPLRFKYELGECPYWNKTDTIISLDDCGCPYKLDCNKCHGWFENRYHLSNLKSSQEEKPTKGNESQKNVQALKSQDLIKDGLGMGTGAPFYKIEQKKDSRPNSRKHEKYSDKSQPKETNSQEDASQANSTKPKTYSKKSFSTMKGVKGNKKGKNQKCYWIFYLEEDGRVWLSSSSSQKSIKKSPTSARKKQRLINQSESNKKSYTNSFKKIIAQYGLQQKVLSLGIHQFSLLNFNEEEIANEECFSQLTNLEKQKLIRAVSNYNKDPAHLKYSDSLKSIFKRRQQQAILQKLHTRKISQNKLLNLSHNSINQMSFLAEQQKEKLPVILQNYNEQHRDFKEINEMIKTQTISPP